MLHTWGSAMTHHPHVHIIVPGGGISSDGQRWIACRPGFFLPVRVLSRLFRRLFLEQLSAAYLAGQLQFFGDLIALVNAKAFNDHLAPLRRTEWVVYAKRPFGGPQAVLAYLSRYTHRIAIANSRLVAFNDAGVTFKWKDYRDKQQPYGKLMTLVVDEFIRRFLIHVLPAGFHRIRYYGLLASGKRAENVARARELLLTPPPIIPIDAIKAINSDPETRTENNAQEAQPQKRACPCCAAQMTIIERFARGKTPRHQPSAQWSQSGSTRHDRGARLTMPTS